MDNPGLPPQTSNSYCLPGKAGGTPIGISCEVTCLTLLDGAVGAEMVAVSASTFSAERQLTGFLPYALMSSGPSTTPSLSGRPGI